MLVNVLEHTKLSLAERQLEAVFKVVLWVQFVFYFIPLLNDSRALYRGLSLLVLETNYRFMDIWPVKSH
jgi:hypothetical protein